MDTRAEKKTPVTVDAKELGRRMAEASERSGGAMGDEVAIEEDDLAADLLAEGNALLDAEKD